jgi:hypothetical protein
MKYFGIVLFLLLPLACGDTENRVAADEILEVDTLGITDTIGVLMGDSCYMFGSITSLEALPGGGAVVFDRNTGLISIFDENGEFVRSFGGLGEAPGRFNLPGKMTLLGDGRIAAMDWRDMEVCFFSSEGEYLGARPNRGSEMPLLMEAAGDSGFVTYSCPSRQIEDTWKMGYELCIWEGTSPQPVAVPFQHLFDFGQEEFDFRPGYIAVTADAEGRVFMHRMDSNEYVIEVYDEKGNPIDSILGDPESTSWDEMDRYPYIPVATFMVQVDDQSEQKSGELPDNPPQVERLGVDSLGNVWAQRGNTPGYAWDVFSPSGELLRRVECPVLPDTSFYVVDINRYGIVAWDPAPEDFPRVFMLSFME